MYEYDIAISFAGEDRQVAYKLATELSKRYGLRVFYDDYEQAQLLGANLTEYLVDIYKNKTRYCIVLISQYFKQKRWTRHEWRAAQARAFEEPELDYILPIRLDDTELEGLIPTIGYLSIEKLTIKKIASIINEKVFGSVEFLKTIRKAEKFYADNKFQEALDLLKDQKFDDNIDALRVRGNANGKLHHYNEAITAFKQIAKQLPFNFFGSVSSRYLLFQNRGLCSVSTSL